MKPIVRWTLVAAALLGAMPLVATAQHRDRGWHGDIRHFDRHDRSHWHSGAWRHGSHGGRLGWWWVVGGMWYFYPQPVYPYPDPYRPPLLVEQTPPPAPAPNLPPAATLSSTQYWYYCEASRGYYPYVAACPSGWKTVPATPPGAPQ